MKRTVGLVFLWWFFLSMNAVGSGFVPVACDLGTDCVFNPSREKALIGIDQSKNNFESIKHRYFGGLASGHYACHITPRNSTGESIVDVAVLMGWNGLNSPRFWRSFYLEEGKTNTITVDLYEDGGAEFIEISSFKQRYFAFLIPYVGSPDSKTEIIANCNKLE